MSAVDPFADDIVEDPRRVDYSVPGLNDAVAERVVAGIEALRDGERPRMKARAPKALLIVSPSAGFGKSHLVGALFRRLNGRATLVNVRPFEDPDTCWKSVLMRVVQELDFPDRYTESDGSAEAPTQLDLFAHGVLSQVVAGYLKANNGNPRVIETLSQPAESLTYLKDNPSWRKVMDRHIVDLNWVGGIRRQIAGQGLHTRAGLDAWLKVLYAYAYRDDNAGLRQACLDWLQGEPIDEEAAAGIGVRPADRVGVDQTVGAINDLAKSRILDLCRLAGFFRPFLICFDQTETYGKSRELARALGTVIADLADEGSNQQAVMTANLDPWEKRLRAHWEEASINRLATPLSLEGLDAKQGGELAAHRLTRLNIGGEQAARFWGDRQWLDGLFRERGAIGVRAFLHACSARWSERVAGAGAPAGGARTPLSALFERHVAEVGARARHLVYDRDVFHWLFGELAGGIEAVTVDSVTARSKQRLPRWAHGGKRFVFCFESGTHWKRWHNIARSVLPGGALHDSILVCPRTPELPPIPKSTWKVARADIEQAKRTRLLILELDREQLARLYAAQELYAGAVQGDIDWQPEEVADYLRGELSGFWQTILDWPGNGGDAAPEREVEEQAPAGWQRKAIDIIRRKRFLSLDELIEALPGQPDREAVLRVCQATPRVKVHAHSRMTVLQWQSTD